MADQNHLLSILQAHGQQFLNSFSLPSAIPSSRKRKRSKDSPAQRKAQKLTDNDSEEEWGGINDKDGSASDETESKAFKHDDDEFTSETSNSNVDSKIIVFQDIVRNSSKSDQNTKAQMKAFMSSKISKLRQDVTRGVEKETRDEIDDELTNVQNDAILHRLVHTKLLSGSLNPDLEMTPAQRRKALAGRVLELSGTAKIGKGEKSVREKERNKASKHVRDGLKERQKERARQELEEAKDLGNYHPTLKRLFEHSESLPSKKRERGLRMGVGKFRGGFLELGHQDISMIADAGRNGNRGGGRSQGGGRGRRGRSKG